MPRLDGLMKRLRRSRRIAERSSHTAAEASPPDELCPRCPDLRTILFQEDGFHWDHPTLLPGVRSLGYLRSHGNCPSCRLTLSAFQNHDQEINPSVSVLIIPDLDSISDKDAEIVQIHALLEPFGCADWDIHSESFDEGKSQFSAPVCRLRFYVGDESHNGHKDWADSDSFEILPQCGQSNMARFHLETGQRIPSPLMDLYHARLVKPQLDTALMQSWLQFCETYGANSADTASRESGKRDHVIRLIDVTNMCLIRSTTAERYFALSYVWGSSNSFHLTSKNSKELHGAGGLNEKQLPRTIRDCVHLCRQLGSTYLWVDSLCIEQDNDQDKDLQISQMEEIYANSVLTIVNACRGDVGADSPLPGVQPNSRSLFQEVHQIGDFRTVLSRYPRQQHFRKGCKWSTRAWTLQEELLSGRVLYISDTHAWFQCGGGCFFSEDVVLEPLMDVAQFLAQPEMNKDDEYSDRILEQLETYHLQKIGAENFQAVDHSPRDLAKAKSRVTNANQRDRNYLMCFKDYPETHYFQPWVSREIQRNAPVTLENLFRDVESYTRRQITYDGDILSAISALLRRTTNLDRQIPAYFHHGMPVAALDYALTYIEDEPCITNRREQFPSWSWAGWRTAVSWSVVRRSRPDHFVSGAGYQLTMSQSLFSNATFRAGAKIYDQGERSHDELLEAYGFHVAPHVPPTLDTTSLGASLVFYTSHVQLRVGSTAKDLEECPRLFRDSYDRFKLYPLMALDAPEGRLGNLRLEEGWRRSQPSDLVVDLIVVRATPCPALEDYSRPGLRNKAAQPPGKWGLSLLCVKWLDGEMAGDEGPRKAERLTLALAMPSVDEWMGISPRPRQVFVELV